jgi:hypothetical protein
LTSQRFKKGNKVINLKEAAKSARIRISERLVAANSQKKGLPQSAAIVQEGASFRVHLFEALRRSGDERNAPSSGPDSLYLAFPEKLLGKWYYLAYGPQRENKNRIDNDEKPEKVWEEWNYLCNDTKINNLLRTTPKSILLAHGLSAIDDSVFLLADIGRAYRISRALQIPISILLADVSWIQYNRSLKRFNLTEEFIESGLRQCQDRRQRLYEGIGASVKIHAILPYSKKGAISAQKVQHISSHYLALAAMLWGEDKVAGINPLNNSDVAMIGKQLQISMAQTSPLQILSEFPGALKSLENALSMHLNIIRIMAQKFRILSIDTFSYFFAQYYAQDEYRGNVIKIAPVSEKNFDEPYDTLDDSFRLWGDGNDPKVEKIDLISTKKKRMAAVYLPQYKIGDWEILPYTSLSLSATASGGTIENVKEHLILLSDNDVSFQPKVANLIKMTILRSGVVQLNRLAYDIISFIQAVNNSCGKPIIDASSRKVNITIESELKKIGLKLEHCYLVECEETADMSALWSSWLDSIDSNRDMNYMPSHIYLATMTDEDWNEAAIEAMSKIIILANRIACDLSI